ncbi:MAG TPA: hypothetical protein VEQ42_01230 [Pyrinomonadaceae bacterium]|nr:hypothetical protein [Pyrinomonadaceae bacterium]
MTKQTKKTNPLKAARLGVVNDKPLENVKRAAEKIGLILHARPKRETGDKRGKR